MYFFTADQHYEHSNIILPNYCDRPFKNIEEMNESIIDRHNEVVKPGDTVVNAGDFCWFKRYYAQNSNDDAISYINRLNGQQIFLKGDHDKWMSAPFRDIWSKRIGEDFIVVCHYAMHTWARSHYNSWHLYAHSHKELDLPGKRINISVDSTDFYPLSFEQIKEIMSKRADNPDFLNRKGSHR